MWSLLPERSVNYGIEVAFNPEDRIKFEKKALFPLAGLNAEPADQYLLRGKGVIH